MQGLNEISHRQINAEKEAATKPKEDEALKKDYSLKAGETISINIGKAGVSGINTA